MVYLEQEPRGQLQQDVGADLGCSCPKDKRRWMKSLHRDKFTKVLTDYFHEVVVDWTVLESQKVVNAIESLLFRTIDTDLLMENRIFKEGVTFNFNVVENINTDELLDQMMMYHDDKWHFIQNVFAENGTVDLVYEDRYLNSPLGCLMLAQFIRRIQFLFHLNYRSIRVFLSKKDFHVMYDDETLKLERKFSYPENRDKFLCQCMNKIVGQPYELVTGNTKHTRALSVSNGEYELAIHFEGSISHGWGLETSMSHLTADVIMQKDEVNIPCYNLLAHTYDRKGVPFMIEFKPVEKKTEIHQENQSLKENFSSGEVKID